MTKECPSCGGEMHCKVPIPNLRTDWWYCSECGYMLSGEVMEAMRPSEPYRVVRSPEYNGFIRPPKVKTIAEVIVEKNL